MGDRKAAIDIDEIKERPLGEISAADFVSALNAGGLQLGSLVVWPEKKKVELWLEPENFSKIPVGAIIDVIRVEKKKAELEKPPIAENVFDFRWSILPQMLGRMGQDVEGRLGR